MDIEKKNLVFLSDNPKTIVLYRSDLIIELQKEYCLSEHYVMDVRNIFSFVFARKEITVSSNLRANLINLIFWSKKKVIILNGTGRLKKKLFFRKLLLLCLFFQRKNLLICQNYQDFRYFRKYSHCIPIFIMGSGGKRFDKNRCVEKNPVPLMVSRSSKIILQKEAIFQFSKIFAKRLDLVGVTGEIDADLKLVLDSRGWMDRSKIFSLYSEIFHPGGYGEGFPHVLADAFCNDFQVIISKKDFINYGLYRFISEYEVESGFVITQSNAKSYDILNLEKINQEYISHIDRFVKKQGVVDAT